MAEAGERARKGGGARGRSGTQLPKSAPVHSGPKVGSKAWHAAKREALTRQRAAVGAKMEASRERHYPVVRHGGFTCQNCRSHDWHAHPVMTKEGAHHPTLVMQ